MRVCIGAVVGDDVYEIVETEVCSIFILLFLEYVYIREGFLGVSEKVIIGVHEGKA
jgi:hypothetical protein